MHETLPCKICGRDIDEGQLCDHCKGLSEHRNVLNGTVQEESVDNPILDVPFYGELVNCNKCGDEFTPWKNGAFLQRRYCQPCVIAKRKATFARNRKIKSEAMEAKQIWAEMDAALKRPVLITEPRAQIVQFMTEPELAGKIAVLATRYRRTFEQQVLYILESAIKSIEG